jgi:succinoglycan biosynthesis protein ExoA
MTLVSDAGQLVNLGRLTDNPAQSLGPALAVVPCLNEVEHIGRVVNALLDEAGVLDLGIVVVDGGSLDGTREAVEQIAKGDSRVVLLDNPHKIQSAALNEAVRRFGHGVRFLIRIDAHAEYPPDYCARLIATQMATAADSVVVTMRTEGESCFQRAAAVAQNSILGNGGASHRSGSRGGWVEHGHHALMTLAAFRAVGGYDESFSHNEDVELDLRFREAGFRIFLTGEAPVVYYPRRSASALFLQYFNIGRGRARNFLKHRGCAKFRHLVLIAIAPALLLLFLAPYASIFAFPALAWCALCTGYGLLLGIRSHDPCAMASGVAAMTTQAGWSFGFLAQLALTAAQHCGAWLHLDESRGSQDRRDQIAS